jgi:hypothetical protein
MKKIFFLSCVLFVICLSALPMTAQPIPEPLPGPPPPDPEQPVPLTGIEILLGAGAALGVKKIIDSRKKV